jgi:NADH dehydrogenase
VELAGAFAELTRHVLQGDFRRIEPRSARVVLVEAGPRLLAHLPPELSAKAESKLARMGVEVRTRAAVKSVAPGCVELENEVILAENVVWAAGVSASPMASGLGVPLDRAGRIKVNPDLSIPGHPEAFAIGDLALVLGKDGRPVPGVSPAAMQMAGHVARIIAHEIAQARPGAGRPEFHYWNRGDMATIGRSAAVARIGPIKFNGFGAWLAWLFVHLVFLIGFRNKIAVLFNWAYSYFTYKRGMRIITGLGSKDFSAKSGAP